MGLGDLKSNVCMLRFQVVLGLERVLDPPQLTRFSFSKHDGSGGPFGSETQRLHVAVQCRPGIGTRSGATSVDVIFFSKTDGVGGPWGSEIQRWHVAIGGHSGIGMHSGATFVDVIFLLNT